MDPAGQKMMGRHSTRGFVKLNFETESPGAPDRGHKTFRRRPLVIQFSRSLPPPTSRVCGQLARSCCAPAVTDRGDPQTSPASPRVRSPSPPEPGDPGVPRREGRRAPAPGPGYPGGGEHRGPLSPPLGPPGTRSLAKCRGLASEPPSRPLAHPPVLTVAAASSRRPSFQAAPASSGAANTQARPPLSLSPPARPPAPARWPRPPELGWPRPPDHAPRCVRLAWRGAWTPPASLLVRCHLLDRSPLAPADVRFSNPF